MSEENTQQSTDSVENQSQTAEEVNVTDAVSEMDEKLQSAQSNEEGPESAEEALEALDEAAEGASKETKEAIKDLKRKLILKVDGEEIEEEIDLGDEDYLKKQLQLAKVSQKRMQEYANLEKEVRDFVQALKEDPKRVLSDPSVGIDLKELAQAVIEEEIENSKKSPEQLEKERLEAELRELKQKHEEEQKRRQDEEFQRLEQQEAERYDMLMTRALEKADVPKTPYVVKKMADYMYLGLQQGIELKPDDVLPLVREEIQSDIKQMFSVMPEKLVEELIGSEVLGKIRKSRVEKAKKAPKSLKKSVSDTGKTKEQKTAEKKTFKQFFGV